MNGQGKTLTQLFEKRRQAGSFLSHQRNYDWARGTLQETVSASFFKYHSWIENVLALQEELSLSQRSYGGAALTTL